MHYFLEGVYFPWAGIEYLTQDYLTMPQNEYLQVWDTDMSIRQKTTRFV